MALRLVCVLKVRQKNASFNYTTDILRLKEDTNLVR